MGGEDRNEPSATLPEIPGLPEHDPVLASQNQSGEGEYEGQRCEDATSLLSWFEEGRGLDEDEQDAELDRPGEPLDDAVLEEADVVGHDQEPGRPQQEDVLQKRSQFIAGGDFVRRREDVEGGNHPEVVEQFEDRGGLALPEPGLLVRECHAAVWTEAEFVVIIGDGRLGRVLVVQPAAQPADLVCTELDDALSDALDAGVPGAAGNLEPWNFPGVLEVLHHLFTGK